MKAKQSKAKQRVEEDKGDKIIIPRKQPEPAAFALLGMHATHLCPLWQFSLPFFFDPEKNPNGNSLTVTSPLLKRSEEKKRSIENYSKGCYRSFLPDFLALPSRLVSHFAMLHGDQNYPLAIQLLLSKFQYIIGNIIVYLLSTY